MRAEIHVVLYGSLGRACAAGEPASPRVVAVPGPAPLEEILAALGIAPSAVQVAMVNHRAVGAAARLRPGDRLALFPAEYPFFADWKDWREPAIAHAPRRVKAEEA